jgi:acylphosphatase
MERVRVNISGEVQGVFFRATCARRARELDVSGWVRNASDGSVEAVFEGPGEAVDALVAWCRVGPPGALIEGVSVVSEPPVGDRGFRVVR